MSRDRRRAPRLESLEGRQLLSRAHFDHIVARATPPLVLNGTMKGSLSTFLDTPGPPETLSEVFNGRARSMGAVRAVVSDQIDPTTGALLGGQVVMSNPRGSVRLAFGPNSVVSNQTAGNLATQVVRYTVAQGTGAYAGASGSGTFTVLQNNGKSSTLVFQTSGS
jgi:hypothetical protein